jgi:hypothetical protein
MYVQSIPDYQFLEMWPILYKKKQDKQLTRTIYKGERFILRSAANVDGSICRRKAHIVSPADEALLPHHKT